MFILRFSSTSAYGILDSDSRATGVTWCYTLKIRLDVRASACIAALAMLLYSSWLFRFLLNGKLMSHSMGSLII